MGRMNEGGRWVVDIMEERMRGMGGRMVKGWIVLGLKEMKGMKEGVDVVELFLGEGELKELVEEKVDVIGDLEGICWKGGVGGICGGEVVEVKRGLEGMEGMKNGWVNGDKERLGRMGEDVKVWGWIGDKIGKEIEKEGGVVVKKGGVIGEGVNGEVEEVGKIGYWGKD